MGLLSGSVGSREMRTIGWVYQASMPKVGAKPFVMCAPLAERKFGQKIFRQSHGFSRHVGLSDFWCREQFRPSLVDMHPDSALSSRLKSPPRASAECLTPMPMKPVSEIRAYLILHAGTGHFGLVAFDLFSDVP